MLSSSQYTWIEWQCTEIIDSYPNTSTLVYWMRTIDV
jgi:hypothetical protein